MSLMGFARRLRSREDPRSEPNAVETVICSKCGQRFVIQNSLDFQSEELEKKQASWVADQLVWDHIHERKHHGRIELPAL